MGLHLELSLDEGAVESALDLAPLDVGALDTIHGKEQVFNEQQLLNFDWVLP